MQVSSIRDFLAGNSTHATYTPELTRLQQHIKANLDTVVMISGDGDEIANSWVTKHLKYCEEKARPSIVKGIPQPPNGAPPGPYLYAPAFNLKFNINNVLPTADMKKMHGIAPREVKRYLWRPGPTFELVKYNIWDENHGLRPVRYDNHKTLARKQNYTTPHTGPQSAVHLSDFGVPVLQWTKNIGVSERGGYLFHQERRMYELGIAGNLTPEVLAADGFHRFRNCEWYPENHQFIEGAPKDLRYLIHASLPTVLRHNLHRYCADPKPGDVLHYECPTRRR